MLSSSTHLESNRANNLISRRDPLLHINIPSLAQSSFPPHQIAQTNLSDKQIEALLNAQSRYHIQILEKTIDGQRKTIVIFGETHVTDESGQIQAKSVIAHFPHRAMEGIDATNYPFANAYSALLKRREKAYCSGSITGMTLPGAESIRFSFYGRI